MLRKLGMALLVIAPVGSLANPTAPAAMPPGEATARSQPTAPSSWGMPEPWRTYFENARTADAIEDPLARCLATPDLPGVRWAAGYSTAHCRYHHVPVPSVADVDAAIRKNDFRELDAALDDLVRGHRSGDERMHRFFRGFGVSQKAGDVARAWAKARPRSAYAALAYAIALEDDGWSARGGKLAIETTPEQFRAMSAGFDKAEAQYRKAADAEPALTDAYAGLIAIGNADRPEVAREALQTAQSVDPACAEVARRLVVALSPRWGGSREAQQAFIASLEQHLPRRPLLAHTRSFLNYDTVLHDRNLSQDESRRLLRDAVDVSGMEDTLVFDPAEGASEAERFPASMARWLQAGRFEPIGHGFERSLIQFLRLHDPAWAELRLRRLQERTSTRD